MPNIIGVGVSPSTGMRKGNIIDVDETISNISAALEDAERMGLERHRVGLFRCFLAAPIQHILAGDSFAG